MCVTFCDKNYKNSCATWAIFLTFKVPPEICIILQKVFVTIYVMANITETKCNFDFHKKIPLAIDNNFTTFILKSYCRRFYA